MLQIVYEDNSRRSFSSAFDVYCFIRIAVHEEVSQQVLRSTFGKFQASCPSCVYSLNDEEPMKYSMLVTIDGNESLKRVERTREGEDGVRVNVEREDGRTLSSHLFIEPEVVDVFKYEVKRRVERVSYLLLIVSS